ncbi:putative DNA-binding transcriptional regulator YafY [Amaricoccus macauensis]|uniref:Putative DNA-binding transcriptional regulator YafY n=1 Tax=Amaricoccus macauensis TaxID=57001 RepID=A0A840SH16_9RHOB|nr:HTH domain-containing protein [Amaricoccus macauensis]MBB5220214.1 putative DNA-binding transcriptional regulator YafY [Amaricoccus macauensis]
MSRAERLLDLIQTLRRHRTPVTGQALAEELGVSLRTLYRDIATLQGQGADIVGGAGRSAAGGGGGRYSCEGRGGAAGGAAGGA